MLLHSLQDGLLVHHGTMSALDSDCFYDIGQNDDDDDDADDADDEEEEEEEDMEHDCHTEDSNGRKPV